MGTLQSCLRQVLAANPALEPKTKPARLPSERTILKWINNGKCLTVRGCCWVEPDNRCWHGSISWAVRLGLI